MRYVPIERLTSGMVLGKDLFDGAGRVLLSKHVILSHEYISNLSYLGFQGAYIDESFTRGLEIQEILQPEVKREALHLVTKMFNLDTLEKGDLTEEQRQIQHVVSEIIENILEDGDIMMSLLDLKTYDDYTYFHSVNVATLSVMIGAYDAMEREELLQLAQAAILHDIGKKFLDVNVLNLPRALNRKEKEIVREHARLGHNFLRNNFEFPQKVCVSVLDHHERYDGAGYPNRKKGDEILDFARIIAIAENYDAMVSKRPYRGAVSPSDAVEYLMSESGGAFDPRYIKIFARKIAVYPIGCEVELSNGKHAIVVKNYQDFPLRPKVRILENEAEMDLSKDTDARNVTIKDILL